MVACVWFCFVSKQDLCNTTTLHKHILAKLQVALMLWSRLCLLYSDLKTHTSASWSQPALLTISDLQNANCLTSLLHVVLRCASEHVYNMLLTNTDIFHCSTRLVCSYVLKSAR